MPVEAVELEHQEGSKRERRLGLCSDNKNRIIGSKSADVAPNE